MQPASNLITIKETAAYLNIPLPTAYYLVQKGQLPAVQIGGRWRVKKDILDRQLLQRERYDTVLVVDDDPGMQSVFEVFLKQQGLTPVIVGSGKEALAALRRRRFDFCFLDLQLPDINGDEIYKAAKISQPALPVVIITGYPDSVLLDNILQHGPVTVLKKPLQVEMLQQALRMLGHQPTKIAA